MSYPNPPYPIGPRDGNNAKHTGWHAFFHGVGKDDCPFPQDRSDLQAAYRIGWQDAKDARKGAQTMPAKSIPPTKRSAIVSKLHDIKDWVDKARLAVMRDDVESAAQYLNAVRSCTEVAKSYLED